MKVLPMALLWLGSLVVMAYVCADLAAYYNGPIRFVFPVVYGILFRLMMNPVVIGFREGLKTRDLMKNIRRRP